ncbi:heparinase II/III domain-containing protein [Desertivirga xinjiangensis]|uniref:heparinase II/III domain-containing protein n=1 Tax=Desertivirga xinjiangensis TaxID=539206 RepID=UPI00210B3873|nr:heparinase II/III family protein [Pedobacter xinjiangensis]
MKSFITLIKFAKLRKIRCSLCLAHSLALSLVLSLASSKLQAQDFIKDNSQIKAHPRLLLPAGEEKQVMAAISKNALWKNVHNSILDQCDSIMLAKPLERKLIGRRLLQVSREGIRRVFFLSYAWRMTEKKKYLKRCEEELLSISRFADWNPDHFLDVAEMTFAAAIGYDWLFNSLSPASRKTISEAIIKHGIEPSLNTKYNGWLRGKNNWNQVCNAGITFGALAVYEDQPEVSGKLVERAISSIRIPMKEYGPDGNYAEGYSYWGYGTSYNVFFINAIENLTANDYGLKEMPGFMKTAAFYENLIGTSRQPFNYSDCGGIEGLQPAMFWFANQLKEPSLLHIEKSYLQTSKFNAKTNRFLPAALIWGYRTPLDAVSAPQNLLWQGKGENQIAVMRTAWDKLDGIYVGFKGGSPSLSHGHMDAGSFVMDAEGVRWSADLGMQQYNSLESAGLDIWNMSQNSDRWKVFRYTNHSHSTLTVNNQHQNVSGNGTILKSSGEEQSKENIYAVMDISSLYKDNLKSAQRGIAVINGRYVNVRDEIETGDKECVIRWAMLTPAKIESSEGNQLELSNQNKKLVLYVDGIPGVKMQTWNTDPPNSYDAVNLGTRLVGFEVKVPANTKLQYNVVLLPGNESIAVKKSDLKPLANW